MACHNKFNNQPDCQLGHVRGPPHQYTSIRINPFHPMILFPIPHWFPIGKSLGFPELVSGVAMTVTDSETWSIGSVEPVNVADPSQSRLLRSSFFYTGLASLLAWQVVLSLGRCEYGEILWGLTWFWCDPYCFLLLDVFQDVSQCVLCVCSVGPLGDPYCSAVRTFTHSFDCYIFLGRRFGGAGWAFWCSIVYLLAVNISQLILTSRTVVATIPFSFRWNATW